MRPIADIRADLEAIKTERGSTWQIIAQRLLADFEPVFDAFMQYEHTIGWNTECQRCAHLLDSSYELFSVREGIREMHSKTSVRYSGSTEKGRAHLAAGGTVGGVDGMSFDEAMNATTICAECAKPTPCPTLVAIDRVVAPNHIETKQWHYINKELKRLAAEYDTRLQNDGDQLKHARATDIISKVFSIVRNAQRMP